MNIIEKKFEFKNNLAKRYMTKKIIIHHANASKCSAEDIHTWHLNRGWSGIGYHFVVRKDGTIERGRPIDRVGAHCTGQNVDSIGVCFEGDYEKETMPDVQLQAGRELIAYIKGLYGKGLVIAKHKSFMATDCPGKNFPFDELIKVEKKKTKKKTYSGKFPTLPQKDDGYYFEKGDKGEQVKLLQKFLNWYGDYGLAVDGDFGRCTLSAVRNYQLSESLKIDGLWGNKCLTRAKKVKK